jgi:hypothetical protein
MATLKETMTARIEGNVTSDSNSFYFQKNGVTVRVSNHLPKAHNWFSNEPTERSLFVLVGNFEMEEVEKYLENEIGNSDWSYLIISEEEEVTEWHINKINRIIEL